MDGDLRGTVRIQLSVKSAISALGNNPALNHTTLEIIRRDEDFRSKLSSGSMTLPQAQCAILKARIQANERLADDIFRLNA